MNTLISLLSTDGFIVCNKQLIKTLGLNSAVLLGELCSEYMYYERTGKLCSDDSFYSTQTNIEDNTGLSIHEQRQAIKKLSDFDIITVTKKGMPAKNYYKINMDSVVQFLNDKSFKISTTSSLNFTVNNNNNKNNKSNNIPSKDGIRDSDESESCPDTDTVPVSVSGEPLSSEIISSKQIEYDTVDNTLEDRVYNTQIKNTKNLALNTKVEADNFLQLNEPVNTKSKSRKKTNKEEYADACLLIDNFTSDEKLRKTLKELFQYKVDECGKNRRHFYATTCKNYLDELSEVKDKLGAVRLSIQYSYTMKVMEPNSMNKQDIDKHLRVRKSDEVLLAKDEEREKAIGDDGNPLVF